MRNITQPKAVSFEDALRNLATKLTGRALSELPRTQEGIVQFMADNVPSIDELADAVAAKVIVELEAMAEEANNDTTGGQDGEQTPTPTPSTHEPEKAAGEAQGTIDIVNGRITEESLKAMTNANLVKLAESLGADVSKCKNKTDYVAVLSQVEVQADTAE